MKEALDSTKDLSCSIDKIKDVSKSLVSESDKPKECCCRSESESIKAAKTIDQMDSLFEKAKGLVEAPKIAEIPFPIAPKPKPCSTSASPKPCLSCLAGHNIVHKNELNCKKSGYTASSAGTTNVTVTV